MCISQRLRPIIEGAALIGLFFLLSAPSAAADKSPFTVSDSLRIKSFSLQSMTEEGRYLAGSLSVRLDRLGTDHKRYRDPTYIPPRLGEITILDTVSQQMTPLFKTKVQARSLTWSPDGRILAFFLLKDGRYSLYTYDRKQRKLEEISLGSQKSIASNSYLIWSSDGSRLLLALRDSSWEKESLAMFKEATEGPIIVYDSREPFLKWDVIRDQALLLIPALVSLKDGSVTELLPEDRYGGVRLAKDDSFITYVVTYPLKTEYGQNYYRQGGREYELCRLDLKLSAQPRTLIKKTKKRLNLSWNEENTLFAWSDEGDIFLQSVTEVEPRNLTKDKVTPEEAGEVEKDEKKTKTEKGAERTSEESKNKETEKSKQKVRFTMMRFSPDGSRLLARTKKGYWLIDHRKGTLEMVYNFPDEEDVDTPRGAPSPASVVSWSPDGRYLYMTYSAKDKWERGYTRYDLKERRMSDLVKDSNLYRGLQMSKDGQKFFCNFSNGDLPSDIYMTDKDFTHKIRLTELNPWVLERKLTRSELIKYLDVDGKELTGILYYPVDYAPGKKYPLVCEIYERFFDNGFHPNMNIIANQGWFGLRPSVDLVEGYPGEAWVKGVTSVINKLIEKEMVDPDKLGVHGTSYGGYATSLLITQTNRFAAAVNISGKVNIISFLGDSPRIGHRNYGAAEAGQDRLGKTLWEAPLKYINHSAVMFADRIETPHLLITGEGDWNVPAVNTRELYYALRRLGKTCVWVNYWHDGHGMGAAVDEATYQDKWDRVLDWYTTFFAEAEEGK